MARQIEKLYRFKPDKYNIKCMSKITVIGCGGNGSHLIPNLARLVKTLGRKIEIVLVDGDEVEDKNLIRQHFIQADVGKNKAAALAKRYSAALGVEIGHVPEYLTSENASGIIRPTGQLIISCTDNLKSRKLISNTKGNYWIDLGNEESSGQVVFSYQARNYWAGKSIKDNTEFPMPDVFDIFPAYNEKVLKEVPIDQASCAEMAEESPVQLGFVNANCATIAINYAHALLTNRAITNNMVFFSIDNAFEHRPMTKSVVESWVTKYKGFSGANIV